MGSFVLVTGWWCVVKWPGRFLENACLYLDDVTWDWELRVLAGLQKTQKSFWINRNNLSTCRAVQWFLTRPWNSIRNYNVLRVLITPVQKLGSGYQIKLQCEPLPSASNHQDIQWIWRPSPRSLDVPWDMVCPKICRRVFWFSVCVYYS